MNENTPGFCFSGFLIMILMPRFINGLEKSTTRSRAEVIVNGATAKSASWNIELALIMSHLNVLVVDKYIF